MTMKMHNQSILLALALLVVGACATVPTGPSVMVLPPPGKPFDQFQAEDAMCRQWARQQIGLSPQETINQNVATGAVAGTAIGAGVGAAIGSASHQGPEGALIGAAGGLLVGTSAGANAGRVYGGEAQRRYDIAYEQCMYANGNIIPGMRSVYPRQRMLPPPPPSGVQPAPPESLQPPVEPPSAPPSGVQPAPPESEPLQPPMAPPPAPPQ